MITYKKGNIFDEEVQVLVNPVNCVGVMGKGLALEFKNRYPENFISYAIACKNKELTPGKLHIHTLDNLTGPKYIVNFPTKDHWKDKSVLIDVVNGLYALKEWVEKNNIQSIAMPALGCGLGGLKWDKVKDEMMIVFSLSPVIKCDVVVFEPS